MTVAALGCKQLTVLASSTYCIGETREQGFRLNVSSGKHNYIQIFAFLSFSILCTHMFSFQVKTKIRSKYLRTTSA